MRELANSIPKERQYSCRLDHYKCMLSDAAFFNITWFPNEKSLPFVFTSFSPSLCLSSTHLSSF